MRKLLFTVVLLLAAAPVLSAQSPNGSVAVTLEIRGNATTNLPSELTPPVRQEATISSHKVASPTNSAWSLAASRHAGDSRLLPPAGFVVTCIEVVVCRMGAASDRPGAPSGARKSASAPAILIIFPDL